MTKAHQNFVEELRAPLKEYKERLQEARRRARESFSNKYSDSDRDKKVNSFLADKYFKLFEQTSLN